MKKIFRFLGIGLLIAAVSAGTTHAVLKYGNLQSSNLQIFKSSNDSTGIPVAYSRFASLPQAGETDFTQAAELSVNAVVHVKTTYRNQVSSQQMDLFEFFFGRPGQQREMPAQQASGSGVIISEDGYIVTNNHVIDRADQIQVVLNDKREYTATLVGTDPNTDIALLKIEETGLPVILMGNSDDLRVGEWVLAVGNPFNLTSTVTAGIVSAKARNINILNAEMKIESFIQTDAAVNPGNSGGALVNTRGELVGINTAIASQTGSYSGYSFAVPTSIVQKVVSDIRQYGVVQRAILGVQMREITSELQKEKKLSTLQGAYVERVVPDGAAEKAGIKSGDVITRIDDAAVKTGTDLQEHIGRHRPGDAEDKASVLGATFSELTDAQKERLGINYGLQIKSLKTGKLKSAGVPSDFIILKVNNRSVRTEEDLDDIVRRANSASERDRVLFITGCTPQGRVRYYAVNLAE